MSVRYCGRPRRTAMSTRTYEGWWDLSLIDERNERPFHAAFVAVIAVWAIAILLALTLP